METSDACSGSSEGGVQVLTDGLRGAGTSRNQKKPPGRRSGSHAHACACMDPRPGLPGGLRPLPCRMIDRS